MNEVIIFTNATGGVSICIPTGELPVSEVQSKDIPVGVASFIVTVDSLPHQDEDFYDAWEQTDGVVTVSLSKAKEITKARLREERAPLFAALDVQFQRALEDGSDASEIVAEKRRLRDITNLADSCSTLDELRALKVSN